MTSLFFKSINNIKSLSVGLYLTIFFGILIMVIVPFISGGNYDIRSRAYAPTPTPVPCVDTDQNALPSQFAVAGTCTDGSGIDYMDYCSSWNEDTRDYDLFERYCVNNHCRTQTHRCAYCQDGRCVTSPPPKPPPIPSPTINCVDTDANQSDPYSVKGTCIYGDWIEYDDKCADYGTVTEWYCNRNKKCVSTKRACDYLCNNGACNQKPTPTPARKSSPTPTFGSVYTIKSNIGSGLNCDKICRQSYLFCKSIGTDNNATDGNIMSWTDTAFCFRGSGNNCYSIVNNKKAPKTCIYGQYNRPPEWTNCRCYSTP
jgi:hypothetical protein